MVNREAGYITVRATQKQHEQVQRYIDKVMESARRQVLIEATVVEVELSDQYQAGVDWSYISSSVGGLDLLEQSLTAGSLGSAPNALATFVDTDLGGGELQATVRALETFGDVSVMSSPKIMALNNQLAILKVVDNRVYFTIDVEQTLDEGVTNTVFDSQINTVPVGLVMTVTPYIGADDEVLLNTRPTVSRVLGFVEDPNPSLADAGVTNEVPEIQVREMESLLRVNSGQVAVIGGLMQDSIDQSERSVPLVGNLPLIGNFFSYRDDRVEKTELIIFLRPTVIDQANLDGDMKRFRQYLRTPTIESDSAEQP
jgi:general secretion pathway protein D